jgi:hypothetical protein
MEKLTILNTALLWLIIIFMVIKPYIQKITISVSRTFWEKKPYGFRVTKWQHKRNITPNSGRDIFYFNWRNPKSISDDMWKRR